MKLRDILHIIWLPVTAASLCCLSPVILVLVGLSTATFASSLADTLYGTYKWLFRGLGIFFLCIALYLHFRRSGICTLDAARRHKNTIINTVLITLIVGVLGYLFFLYIVVHYIGVALQLW